MLITQVKQIEEIEQHLKGNVLFVVCLGCKEVLFETEKYNQLKETVKAKLGASFNEMTLDYLCNHDYTLKRIELHKNDFETADILAVFACGVGIQTLAGILLEKPVVSCCNTFYVPGFSGFTPSEYDCEQCGECHLGSTAGICPLTACSKGLLNGPCGGAKNGKCEVTKNKECGWEKILLRMSEFKETDKLKNEIKLRDYNKVT